MKGTLIKAAEQGYITQLACMMPECFCPEEVGGACYFEPVTNDWSDCRSDWMPTLEHFPVSKKEGGKAAVDNAILAHRLCNRLDYSILVGRSHARDLERIRKAREEAIRRNNVQIGNTADPEAEAATPKPKKAKMAPEWKSLPDAEKAQYLLDHPTLPTATGRTSLGSRARSATPSSVESCSLRSCTARPSSPTKRRPSRTPRPPSCDLLKDRRSPADCERR